MWTWWWRWKKINNIYIYSCFLAFTQYLRGDKARGHWKGVTFCASSQERMKNSYKILVRKTGRNRELYKRSHRWGCTIKWVDTRGRWRNFGFHKRQFTLPTGISTLVLPVALIHGSSIDLGSRHVFHTFLRYENQIFTLSVTLYIESLCSFSKKWSRPPKKCIQRWDNLRFILSVEIMLVKARDLIILCMSSLRVFWNLTPYRIKCSKISPVFSLYCQFNYK